jgi:ribosomal protein S17E
MRKNLRSYQSLTLFKEGLQEANVTFEIFGDLFDFNSNTVAEKSVQENTQSSKRFPNKVQGNATSYMMERSLARIKSLEVATS